MKQEEPIPIVMDLQFKEAMDSYYDYEQKIYEHNKELIFSIGRTAKRDYKRLIDGCSSVGEIEFVDKPKGENQEKKEGVFKEIWVEQWSFGDSGDSFSGYIYARFSKDKWLKISYAC